MERKFPKITVNNAFALLILLLTIIFLSICADKYSTPIDEIKNLQHINFSGIYTINDDDFSYTIPKNYKIDLDDINKINFKISFKEIIENDMPINLHLNDVNVEVFQNDVEIYSSYKEKNISKISDVIGSRWVSFPSPGIDTDDIITIIVTSKEETIPKVCLNNFLGNISQGDYFSLLKNQLETDLTKILIAVFTFVIGFVLLVVLLTFKIMNSPIEIGSISCAMLIISGSIAAFINYDYITLIFVDSALVYIIDYLNLLLLMLFILFYIRIYIHHKSIIRAIDWFICIWTIIIIGYFICQSLGLSQMIGFTKNIINIAILILAFLFIFLIIEYKNCKGSIFTLNFTMLLILTMLVEVYNKVAENDFVYIAFGLGILLFSTTHFISIMIKAQKSFVQAAKAEQIENELIQSKVSVMLSQIQPHFLYNTLVVIRQLCDINPKTAKEAVTEFATYLRGNLDSLTFNTTIPFEKEMEHIENYVSLEKKRFGDKINLEYDFECLDFDVPSLTVQTIVENAIRHGITKRKEGGTVTIRTRETNKRYIIEVHDNGVGMDLTKPPEYSDNRSHIGLDNVRKRVESMCNGELLFNSTPNIGTTVYMSVPKVEENIDSNKKE